MDKIYEDNQILKDNLERQDQEMKRMMIEIADLQDVGKKTVGEQVQHINRLRNEINENQRESQRKEKTMND